MKIRTLLLFISILPFIGCSDEDVVPNISASLELKNISSQSAIVKGRIANPENIYLYTGVVWATEENPDFENNLGIETFTPSNNGDYEVILKGLESETSYYVRCYARTVEGFTSYSDVISVNTAGVVVTDFTPKRIGIDSILTIKVAGLDMLSDVKVYIGNTEASTVSKSEDGLRVRVPNMSPSSNKIFIHSNDEVYQSSDDLVIQPIYYFMSNNLGPGRLLFANGTNIPPNVPNSDTQVFIGGTEVADDWNWGWTQISIPYDIEPGEYEVKIVVNGIEGYTNEKLYINEPGAWETLPVPDERFQRGFIVSYNDSLHLFHASGQKEIFDPVSQSWSFGTHAFNSYLSVDAYVRIADDVVFINHDQKVYSYNLITDEVTEKASFPGVQRDGAFYFMVNDRMIYGTGRTSGGTVLKDVWSYDLNTNQWTRLSDFEKEVEGAGAFSIKNIGYVGGGSFDKLFYQYDVTTDTWERKADLPLPSDGHHGYTLNHKGYFIGARVFAVTDDWYSINYNGTIEYDPDLDEWFYKADLSSVRVSSQFGVVYGDNIYLLNERSEPESFLKFSVNR